MQLISFVEDSVFDHLALRHMSEVVPFNRVHAIVRIFVGDRNKLDAELVILQLFSSGHGDVDVEVVAPIQTDAVFLFHQVAGLQMSSISDPDFPSDVLHEEAAQQRGIAESSHKTFDIIDVDPFLERGQIN